MPLEQRIRDAGADLFVGVVGNVDESLSSSPRPGCACGCSPSTFPVMDSRIRCNTDASGFASTPGR
jgi:hypothetical protein